LDVSHATETENPASVQPQEADGKRFDHVIASDELNPEECRYVQAGFTCSDHAPLVAEFTG
jgi:endonuclease/exonuclease/phosphatase (EEP) superfamily protein YafD